MITMDYAPIVRTSHEYVEALEEERRKIQVFQRELPLCLELVTQGFAFINSLYLFHFPFFIPFSGGKICHFFWGVNYIYVQRLRHARRRYRRGRRGITCKGNRSVQSRHRVMMDLF